LYVPLLVSRAPVICSLWPMISPANNRLTREVSPVCEDVFQVNRIDSTIRERVFFNGISN
jgi:hypothetical protein